MKLWLRALRRRVWIRVCQAGYDSAVKGGDEDCARWWQARMERAAWENPDGRA